MIVHKVDSPLYSQLTKHNEVITQSDGQAMNLNLIQYKKRNLLVKIPTVFVLQISSSQKRLNWGLPMLTIDLITCNLTFKIFPLYSTNEMFQFPSVCPNAHLEEEWLSGFPHEVQITTNFIQFLKLCQDFLYLAFFRR